MPRPVTTDYPEYFGNYISQVPEDDLTEAFRLQFPQVEAFLHSIDEEKANYSYAPGKWTLKELLQHIIDAERVFNYRALCFARGESVSLPSFDENTYAGRSGANARTWKSMAEELINLRRSTNDLYNSFTEAMLQQKGTANNKSMSVLSLGYTTLGHMYHHIRVVNERYRG